MKGRAQAARQENVLGKGPEAGIKLPGSELRGRDKMTKTRVVRFKWTLEPSEGTLTAV